jgi:Short C-terminal domain
MVKLTRQTIQGWPMMEPLGKKVHDLLQRNLAPGERILGQVIARYSQAIVATDHKVLVVKTGVIAGTRFGGKATSFDYRTIVGVEVRTGLVSGEFEIIAAALSAPQGNSGRDKRKIEESPNGVIYRKTEAPFFDQMAAKIREMTAAAHGSGTAVNPAQQQTFDMSIPEQIKALSGLHQSGILTDQEFAAKKAELLSRM